MKTILDGLKKGLGIWFGFFLLITTGVLAYQFTSYVDVPDASTGQTLGADTFNQLLTNVRDLNTKINAQPTSPIGTIIAWHKNLTGVPALSSEWVECNGQVLFDASSPLNGRTIPDLNNSPSGYNGGRFLRGGTTSGVMQEGTSTRQADWFLSQNLTQNNDGLYNPGSLQYYNILNGPTVGAGNSSNYARIRPVNMSVVWIMRVK